MKQYNILRDAQQTPRGSRRTSKQVGFLDESTELFLLDEAAKEAADGDSDALQSEKPSAAQRIEVHDALQSEKLSAAQRIEVHTTQPEEHNSTKRAGKLEKLSAAQRIEVHTTQP